MTTMRERIAKAILDDLMDRRGIKQGFYDIDDDVMDEIKATLADAVLDELANPSEAMLNRMIGNQTPIMKDKHAQAIEAQRIAFTAAIRVAKEGK